MAVYVCVSMVLVRFVDGAALYRYPTIYTAAAEIGGPIAGYIAGVVGAMTLLSMANSGLLASSRFPFAMARDGALPKVFTSISKQYLTPFFQSSSLPLPLLWHHLFGCRKNRLNTSAFKVLMFFAVNLAVIVFRKRTPNGIVPNANRLFTPLCKSLGF